MSARHYAREKKREKDKDTKELERGTSRIYEAEEERKKSR
jgi:hypothetical protein